MILIGMHDSPFVGRVAIAPRVYSMDDEHRNWCVFSATDQPFMPLVTQVAAR